jgi:hypothetical protein
MKLTNIVLLLSTLSFGVSQAGTAPCNGFKINLKNQTKQQLVVDSVLLNNGTISSQDPQPIDVNGSALYTVNGAGESTVMQGQFLVHLVQQPEKSLKINFDLTNKDLICEVGNTIQMGTLNTQFNRVLGGLDLPIND